MADENYDPYEEYYANEQSKTERLALDEELLKSQQQDIYFRSLVEKIPALQPISKDTNTRGVVRGREGETLNNSNKRQR
ncbi:DUF5137 domain-containing protein KNAG_0D01200 [Huiozyma naganishii CBS 8797]|uniref:Uncharacterized protein n=1 Tax=Huiozyma naganishii (strain ATCC MYA-139 / BCRC 22969 / CBS 8797 / KCTC 17520 / NBRC 10181 / NCYC 3082 / Yp74L-3) TaxID=1071383 RepID=J7RXP5_HUIN7|nr:hypothetical protein KNAG_0D01200 [Kazachstania naganishii CBS 8797]CCK69872.1 hypothetical protein KNAG_0D01200 [Kazachstania naganishii CBS 8797]